MPLQCISDALPHTLMHCISDFTCYATLHRPLHLHLCTCHPCLFVCLFVCLLVSPSGLFLLIDGQWTSAKSNCTHSIRRGLSRRLRRDRKSTRLNSSHTVISYAVFCLKKKILAVARGVVQSRAILTS